MSISKSLLAEFDHEMANTRKTLERLPADKLEWSPHEKSWSMAALASHIANLPVWGVMTLNEESYDLHPPEGDQQPSNPVAGSKQEVLDLFEKNMTALRSAIADASDEKMMAPWSLLSHGETIFTMPRVAVLRSFFMNHLIHHRGQFTVYLRLNNIPLPALYGPSADERPEM